MSSVDKKLFFKEGRSLANQKNAITEPQEASVSAFKQELF